MTRLRRTPAPALGGALRVPVDDRCTLAPALVTAPGLDGYRAERAPALRPQRVPERRRPRAGARRRAVTAVQLQLVCFRQQLNGLRLQLNGPRRQIVAGCGRWPAAWGGVAPAGSVHAVGMNGTLHDGAEQARAVRPAEAPPSSWMH